MIPEGFESRWRGSEKEDAISLLTDLRDILHVEDAPICLVSGTLLGAVRMNSIMPWDDDIDVSIQMMDWDDLCAVSRCPPIKGIVFERVTDRDMHPFMRAFRGNKRFPFIDIFVHEKIGDIVRSYGSNAKQYIDVPVNEWFPYSIIELEGKRFEAPGNPELYCDVLYPDWRTVAKTWDWDHRNDCAYTGRTYQTQWNYEKRQLEPAMVVST